MAENCDTQLLPLQYQTLPKFLFLQLHPSFLLAKMQSRGYNLITFLYTSRESEKTKKLKQVYNNEILESLKKRTS
jgi:hypothetical protein